MIVPLQELFEPDLFGKSGNQKVYLTQLHMINVLLMKLFDVLICIYQFALKEDAIIWAFLYLFPKVRRYRLFDASNFDLIYLYLFDFLVKDKHYLFVFEQLGDVG